MKSTRVILADDHTLLLEALKSLIEPEFEVVGMFADGRTLLNEAPQLNPHVIVLDIRMPTMNGLLAGERLKQLMPSVKLVYLTQDQDPDIAAQAFKLGASAYLLKNSAASELVHAISLVMRGSPYVTPLMTQGMVGSVIHGFKRRKGPQPLTLRQKEVLQLLAEGRSMKEAAFILKVSPRTVAYHKYIMMEHLQLRSSAALIEYALKSSLTCGSQVRAAAV
ncbi:MAG TPA: response regulator transcription factor [Pyrinomonadaceae bacterium]|nr:response regulator transcription factor [Pyrinomonadaceae bacterium]